jgi:putative ABC transport system ATP-binding protein
MIGQGSIVRAENLRKVYRRGAEDVVAVDNVSFEVAPGEFLAIVGPSGAGKSTLLQLIGVMDNPTSGKMSIAGSEVSGLSDAARTRLRRETIGFVFQHFGLLPTLTVAENIGLPLLLSRERSRDRVEFLLERVGLAHRRNHRPAELSGGEMQRVAIARALVNQPRFLLADEPTGNLDSVNSAAILRLFQELRQDGLTIIAVTHNEEFARSADRRLTLRDGKVVS